LLIWLVLKRSPKQELKDLLWKKLKILICLSPHLERLS
jgi:hypothetical protein